MVVFVDLGGTYTKVLFNNKKDLEEFSKRFRKEIFEEKGNIIVFPSFYLKTQKSFFSFLQLLNEISDEIVFSFPEPVFKNKLYSKKFPFLDKLSVNELKNNGVVFITNDLKAFTYYQAKKYFSKNSNRKKIILCVQIGTGVNAIPLSYYEFVNLDYLDRIYETGHSTFLFDREECRCGRKGCAELFISGSYLNKITNNKPEMLKYLENLKEKYNYKLAYFLSSLVLITGASKLVIGGGVSSSLDKTEIEKRIKEIIPYNIEIDIDVEIDSDPYCVVYGLKELWKKINKNGKSKC